jgi:hypothetical protein
MFLHIALAQPRTCAEKSRWHRGCRSSVLPRRDLCTGRLDLLLLGGVWVLCCVRQGGSVVALLADPYLLLSFCLVNVRDAVESRVDHFGILLVRVAIRFCGCARWGLSILNKLPIVPEMVNNWKGGDHCNLLSQHFQLLFAQRIF